MLRQMFMMAASALLGFATPAWCQQATAPDAYQMMQSEFAAAYNRKDTAAMAQFFTEDAIRITPNGILRGRAAIQRDFDKAIAMDLNNYTVRRTVSQPVGDLVFNAGEWQAKLGDHPFHGYYSALVKNQNGTVQIIEETVTVASPRT